MYTPLHGVKIFHREISNDGKEEGWIRGRREKGKDKRMWCLDLAKMMKLG